MPDGDEGSGAVTRRRPGRLGSFDERESPAWRRSPRIKECVDFFNGKEKPDYKPFTYPSAHSRGLDQAGG